MIKKSFVLFFTSFLLAGSASSSAAPILTSDYISDEVTSVLQHFYTIFTPRNQHELRFSPSSFCSGLGHRSGCISPQSISNTLAHISSCKGYSEHSEILFNLVVDPNVRDSKYGRSPLHWAVYWENIEAIKLLFARGANPTLEDNNGVTPAMVAASKGFLKWAQALQNAEVEWRKNHPVDQ